MSGRAAVRSGTCRAGRGRWNGWPRMSAIWRPAWGLSTDTPRLAIPTAPSSFSSTPSIIQGNRAARWLQEVDRQLAAFKPVELREQVTSSWARERHVQTQDEAIALIEDQMPFHFWAPRGAALQEYLRRTAGLARYAPDVIRHFSSQDYGGIDVEDRLGEVTH